MGVEQRQALMQLFAEDEGFVTALADASSLDDLIRLARERGVEVSAEDVVAADDELSDAELDAVSGGSYQMIRFSVRDCS